MNSDDEYRMWLEARRGESPLWREVADGVVAPVVDLATVEHEAWRQLLLDRQQLQKREPCHWREQASLARWVCVCQGCRTLHRQETKSHPLD